ncbi:MAG: hypothetical protein ACRDYE_00270 [Acidimicrobiales bacterium]
MAKARRRKPSPRQPASAGAIGRQHWRADGAEKTRFRTADEANRSALRLRLESGADLDPYRCDWCDGWHLGSRGTGPGDGPMRRTDR